MGVFESGHFEFDYNWVYISLPTAQYLLGIGDSVTRFQIWLEDYSEGATRDSWEELHALKNRLIKENVTTYGQVEAWMSYNRAFFEALKIEKRTMNYILKIIILVATFNIIATLFMVVTEKTRDIGLLRAVGAGRRNILKIFLTRGCW